MTTIDALLRCVCEDPADDLPRLAYADLLEERGEDARAEFIRCQVELAGIPLRPETAPWPAGQYADLRRRERDLLCKYGPAWAEPVARAVGAEKWGWGGPTCGPQDRLAKCNWVFRRGFVAEVSLTLEAFVGKRCVMCRNKPKACIGNACLPGCAAAIFASQPVTAVTLCDREPNPYRDCHGWWEAYEGSDDRPCNLPRALWKLVSKQPGCAVHRADGIRGGWADFRSADDARLALSRAAVALGRSLAKLPPLKEERR